MNFWKQLLSFALPNYEYFTKDEEQVNVIARRTVIHTNMSTKKPEEKRKEAFDIIQKSIVELGIEIATHFINYAIEKAVRELNK
ncbi:MAG: hypothetical protein KAV87_51995 [Desulfobacteraceae bacterium]|nr:hypothetical protein [Desulfobacteraceae bacterium]